MLKTKEEIKDWLYTYDKGYYDYPEKYFINEDLTINVNGDVFIQGTELKTFPVKFIDVIGNFMCDDNYLISLEGCPVYVGGAFDCSDNKLESLEGGPQKVRGSFLCNGNNLKNLKGSPAFVGGSFHCQQNYDMESLDGLGKVQRTLFYPPIVQLRSKDKFILDGYLIKKAGN